MKALLVLLLALIGWPAWAEAPTPFVKGSWKELRETHEARPTLVHFWGITCGPCLVELPRWAELARTRPDIDIVMVSADPVAIEPAHLSAALKKAGLTGTESWRFADPFTERLEFEVDPAWRGELPFTVMLAPGQPKQTVLGAADFGALGAWAEQAKGSAPP